MALVSSVRSWQEPSSESGKILSPVRSTRLSLTIALLYRTGVRRLTGLWFAR